MYNRQGISSVGIFLHFFIAAEKGRDAAYCRNAYNCVHNSGQQTAAAEDKGHKVKVQYADKSPVKSAYNKQSNTYFIKHIHKISPFVFKDVRVLSKNTEHLQGRFADIMHNKPPNKHLSLLGGEF